MEDAVGPGPIRSGDDDRLRLLKQLGFDDLEHDSHVPFMSHLVGTARLLRSWGCRQALCDGGLFHSAYGTEYFEVAEGADRSAVSAVIGADAERVAWLWCTIRRDTLDPATQQAVDRRTGQIIDLSEQDVSDIATLWVADTVEQIARMAPDERSFASGLMAVAGQAEPAARQAVEAIRPLIDA